MLIAHAWKVVRVLWTNWVRLIYIWSYLLERSMRLTPVLCTIQLNGKLSYNVKTNSILDRLCSFSPWTLALPGTQFDCEWTEMWGFLSTMQRTGITSCILLIHGLCLSHCSKPWQEWLFSALACFRGAWVGQCKDQDLVKIVFLKVLEQKKVKGMYFMWNDS